MAKKNELKRIDKKNQEVTKYDFIICPNCGAEEVGKFCPNCGQSNKDFNKPIKEIFGDLLDSINLDIRLVNSLIPFFTKPGFLTEEYFKGHRKKYVPPMRMYILFSVLFFFLAQFAPLDELKGLGKVTNDSAVDSLKHGATAILDETNYLLTDTSINNYALHDSVDLKISENEKVDSNLSISFGELTAKEREELIEEIKLNTDISNVWKKVAVGALKVSDNEDVFWAKFLKNISYVLFLLMPFFALILAITLRKSRMLYVHHLIFSINFHSFIFGLSSILILLGLVLSEKIYGYSSYLLLIFSLYLMLGIKRFYNRSYIRSFFKTFGITFLYLLIIFSVIIIIYFFTAQGFSEM